MNSIWYSLAWKEWHEHKWKLAAITAVLWGVVALVLRLSPVPDSLSLAVAFVILCMVILSVFIGLGAASNERSRNTLPFLQALPVSMWQAAVMKLAIGFMTVIVPIVLALGLVYLWTKASPLMGIDISSAVRDMGPSPTGHWSSFGLLLNSTMATSFFIWAAASGVNRKDEVSAGAVALAVMAGWWLLILSPFYITIEWFHHDDMPRWIVALAFCTAPAGFVQLGNSTLKTYLPFGAGIALTTHFALVVWYVRRFGRVANLEVRSPQAAVRDAVHPGWLSAPRRSAFSAIAWKQFRESVPLALCGIAGVAGISTLFVLSEPKNFLARPDQIAVMSAGVTVVIGFIVALVVGIGVCLHDASPGLNTFWRSRPVDVDLWFWTKYLTGMAVLVAAFYGPLLVILFCLHRNPVGLLTQPGAIPAQLAAFAVFAAAVMTTCLVRHAVYAAILSMGAVYISAIIGLGIWYIAGLIGWVDLPRHGWMEPEDNAPVVFGMALSFVASTLIAWLAVRYDWGRKGRY